MKKMLISSTIALSLFSLVGCASTKCCPLGGKSQCPKKAKQTSCCQTQKKCPLGR